MKKLWIGFDVGGTKCAVVLGESEGGEPCRIKDKIRFETRPERGWQAVTEQLFTAAETLVARNGLSNAQIAACGISCGGPLDSKAGVILSPPNLPDWDHVELVRLTQERLGIPTRLQNDANACALAEWRFGAGRGSVNMVFLTFGTGMGAGLILDGRLYTGANDYAGEVGHIRLSDDGPLGYGKNGSFEGFCSGGGIARLSKQIVLSQLQKGIVPSFCGSENELDAVTAQSVARAAGQGDETAVQIYEQCGEALGRGLAILIDVLNPDTIVIGSIFARSSALLLEKMNEAIAREALDGAARACRIVPAALGEAIGDYAALGVAMMAEQADGRMCRPASQDILERLFEQYPALSLCRKEIYSAYIALRECYARGGKTLVCGNGGSAADADHIVGELMKGFLLRRPVTGATVNHDRDILSHLQGGLPAISLNAHAALLSAFANDEEFDYAYAQQAYAYGCPNDVLIALSTSGNSAGVVNAVRAAGAKGLTTVGITGEARSLLSDRCTVCIRLPERETYRVQELTLPVYHCLCAMLEADFFSE